ncbi:MAG TPA: VOC family protein [Anaerolineae bacterium]|nr:VOC family protein [Anaerolineae bacterium]
MELGNFSVSLAVKDIEKSKAFYEKLGFEQFGGEIEHNWVIMKNGACMIGLFQGMFEQNILTFNPGWNDKAETLDGFMDVRELKEKVKEAGIEVLQEAGEETGPGSFVVVDPDGNPILIDQHV